FFDFLTPSGCSGEVIAAIKAALTNLANQFNGNGGNAPGSAPTVPVSPFRDKPGRPPGYQIRNVHLGDTRDPNIQGVRIGKDGDVIPVRPFGPLDHISNTTKNGPYDPSTGKPSVETRFPLGIPGDPVVTDSDGRPLINEKTHEPLRPWELKDGPPKPKGFDAFQAAQDGFKFIQNLLGQGY
ncbi:MAG: hypothetical protein K2Z81_05510, partial [Cyanobacteria bacterium]|nr:hypothetical protein [Cyanobacteriota bacterium]